MGNKRFTDLPTATSINDADIFAITDVSDLSGSTAGTSKKVTAATLASGRCPMSAGYQSRFRVDLAQSSLEVKPLW